LGGKAERTIFLASTSDYLSFVSGCDASRHRAFAFTKQSEAGCPLPNGSAGWLAFPAELAFDDLESEESMKSAKFATMGFLVGGAALLAGGTAFAQDANAQVGATATTTTTTTVAPAPAPAPAPTPTPMTLPGANDAPAGATDHDAYAGHFGIGYMGRRSLNVGFNGAAGAPIEVAAPVIGMRYWLSSQLGIDAGLGFLFSGGSTKTDPGGVSTDNPGFTVVMLHGGVPLALSNGKHFSFQVIPEMNLGFGSSTTHNIAPMTDLDQSGFHLDLGARAGGELQFGFIGVPELSLQAGVGLAFAVESFKNTTKAPAGETSTSVSRTSLGTSVGNNPWDIFTGNIAALYYFD